MPEPAYAPKALKDAVAYEEGKKRKGACGACGHQADTHKYMNPVLHPSTFSCTVEGCT